MLDHPEVATGEVKRFRADSSVDEIRRFVLGQALVRGRPGPSEQIRVTVRVLPDAVEMSLDSADGRASTKTFSEWFVRILRDEGMTQQAAARRLGVSGKTVNRWVRGHTEPRMRELRRVQAVFGVTPL
jgi:DNA-binding transcriptional regulator YiaG